MRQRAVLGVAVAAVTAVLGCTSTWAKSGATIKDFEREDAACSAETDKAGPWANNWQRERFHDRCLKEHGWSKD